MAARVKYLAPTNNDDSWIEAWDALRINRQTSLGSTTMPAQYTIAWSLPSYDNSRGLALAADYGGGNRFWMRSRRDTAPVNERWKPWVELWTNSNFSPATKANRIPGQVIMFAGKAAPAGTLLCDGAAVSRTTYAELFAAIGTLYGAGDGTTTFNLPAMGDGTVVTHTNSADAVGGFTAGEVIRHAHTASSASAGTHSHTITVAGGGAHSHGASAAAAGDHAHGAWTDSQGHHGHTGGTNWSGDHQHTVPYGEDTAFPWGQDGGSNKPGSARSDGDNNWPYTSPSGNHAHNFTTDGAGAHAHNIGMNGSGNHTHTISVAQVGDHGHSASAADAGAHTHAVTVNNTGGDRNLPAGLRMIYCITY